MKVESEILIESLIVDRLPVNNEVLQLVFFLMSGGIVPPIHVQKVNDGWRVRDGRHRVAAYKLLGLKTINAKHAVIINQN